MKAELDLENLDLAIAALSRAIQTWHGVVRRSDFTADDRETVKAGVIQNFEVAYEQSWKFMRRWLHENVSPGITDGVTRRELFRLAAQQQLINDVDLWMLFHEARNLTSHTYDRQNAEQAFDAACRFLPPARLLLQQLQKHHA